MDEQPQGETPLGTGSGVLSSPRSLVERCKNLWSIFNGDWYICPARSPIHGRCFSILENLQEVRDGSYIRVSKGETKNNSISG